MQRTVLCVLMLGILGCAHHQAGVESEYTIREPRTSPCPSTFSIAAHDPENGDLGVAVASRFLAVGAVVPWVEAGVGAIATQSYANTSFGPRGLVLLRDGWSPEETAKWLLKQDPERESRQLGIVDVQGGTHAFTGKLCNPWAGSRTGKDFTVQGNLLVSEETLKAMERAFRQTSGELALRLVAALEAGEAAGGDARGRQSAAIVIARKQGGYGGFNSRYVDLRVDDHSRPVAELRRLLLLRLGKDAISRARRLEHENRDAEALSEMQDAVRTNPDWVDARFELARLLLESKKVPEAIAELERAVASDPLEAHHHFRAARILAGADRPEAALEQVDKTLALNREYSAVLRRELGVPSSPLLRLKDRITPMLEKAEGE